MRNRHNSSLLKFVIGDVRDNEAVEKVVEGVDYIFHASALKQVPTCEFFPMEAVKTNIMGVNNILKAALFHKVSKVVVLSTDKAVYPINVMGISKAMMEKVMISESRDIIKSKTRKTILCGVRYGNVLYTRGSVIPYFMSLMKQNKQLTITNLDMTRFLLSLDEAIELVFYALTNGKNGYMYIRKSPACTLETLAKALCSIFNYKKGYIEVGVRAGEKMHEALVTKEEMARAINAGKFYKIPPESQGLDYNKYFLVGDRSAKENIHGFTSENTIRLNVKETINILLKLPEIKEALRQAQEKKLY